MERQYQLMYRRGIKPWDRSEPPQALKEIITGPAALKPGTALDLGCGTGTAAAYLARLGWEVTAVDISARAIDIARNRSPQVHWHIADITRLAGTPTLDPLLQRTHLIIEAGCLHGLSSSGRSGWSQTVNAVAAHHARLLVWAEAPTSRPGLPRGITGTEIDTLLGRNWARQPSSGTHALHIYHYQPTR
jgi:SAM-dependent methyltransferase